MTTATKSAISPFAQQTEPNANSIDFLDENPASAPASGIPEEFRKLSRFLPAKSVHYVCAAQRDERNGFPYTAAMEWRHAAELMGMNTLLGEYCLWQWERIMDLSRRLAASISFSPDVDCLEQSSAIRPNMNEIPIATAARGAPDD
jgi:hypothetical protein